MNMRAEAAFALAARITNEQEAGWFSAWHDGPVYDGDEADDHTVLVRDRRNGFLFRISSVQEWEAVRNARLRNEVSR